MSYLIFAVLAGISVTMQNSLNGLINPYLGAMGASFIGFAIQLTLLVIFQLAKEHRMVSLKNVPFYYYSSGIISSIVVGLIGFCVARMGSAVTTCCSVAGQIVMSALVDHFGLFATKKNPFSKKRVPGFVMILLGVLAINLIGGTQNGEASLHFLLLAMVLGSCAIVVRTLNYKSTQAAGSSIGGGFVNSISGTVAGGIFFIVASGFRPDLSAFLQVPLPYYLAGAFGTGCLLCNIAAYKKQNVFYATIFMLIGQVATGILMDVLVFHTLSAGKCIGILIVLTGVLLDKLMTRNS